MTADKTTDKTTETQIYSGGCLCGALRYRGGTRSARIAWSAKDVAQSARVWLIELAGRGNSEAIASCSLFVVDL
ncbi:hypothetical protein [Bradyrhizobium sp. WD16]|uniref:hypothetical protein n=1 Tax=Bradyrhizobium sp. WD16 TaxID=1521768 RepID=UPI0020A27AD2|nr:hypothetical protein [Bradyrhizobium sp. WD16]